MSAQEIDQLYPLTAFLLNELNQEITKDKMKALFDHLQVDFHPKVAELFCVSKEKIDEVYSSVTAAPVAAAPVDAGASAEQKEEAKPKEEAAPAEDIDLFGDDDLFG